MDDVLDYLSDEEAMDADPNLLDQLNRGILTPELQVLLALCLIGEGGRDYLASRCIDSLEALPDDTHNDISHKIADVGAISYPAWQVYRHAMTDQLTTVPALAFLADMLKKINKEHQWEPKVASRFLGAMNSICSKGLLDKVLEAGKTKCPETVLRRTQILKIVFAGARYSLLQCERMLQSTDDASRDISVCFENVVSMVHRIWRVEDKKFPSKSSIEVSWIQFLCLP